MGDCLIINGHYNWVDIDLQTNGIRYMYRIGDRGSLSSIANILSNLKQNEGKYTFQARDAAANCSLVVLDSDEDADGEYGVGFYPSRGTDVWIYFSAAFGKNLAHMLKDAMGHPDYNAEITSAFSVAVD